MEKNSIQAEIASYTGKLFRDNFGKGPSSVYVSIEHPFITIYLRNFLAPMERVLVGQKNYMKVEEMRDLLMQELLPDIKATLRVTANLIVDDLYYDWSLPNRSGLIMGIIKSEEEKEEPAPFADYLHKQDVHDEIIKVSEEAEKQPERTDSLYLNARTLVVKREGILVKIEQELIRSGFSQQLHLSKRQLEKRLLDPKVFETILGVPVQDIFVDWDFNLDTSYIVFILKPE
nr:Na-translocating system protein MpsC family protein [Thalassobacillus sp. CUG 92003]